MYLCTMYIGLNYIVVHQVVDLVSSEAEYVKGDVSVPIRLSRSLCQRETTDAV